MSCFVPHRMNYVDWSKKRTLTTSCRRTFSTIKHAHSENATGNNGLNGAATVGAGVVFCICSLSALFCSRSGNGTRKHNTLTIVVLRLSTISVQHLTAGIVYIDSEIEYTFCFDADLSLVSKDFDTILVTLL